MKRVRAHKKAQDERKLCEEQKAEIEQVVCFWFCFGSGCPHRIACSC